MIAQNTIATDILSAQTLARKDLAAAHQLAVKDNFIEGIDNHFTLSVPGQPDRFYLNAFGLHWSEVTASNLLEVSLDGAVVDGEGAAQFTAACIHGPIHRRGVRCVLHTHMIYTTALSQLEDMTLQPSSQNAVALQDMIAYDRDYNGYAASQDEGERMADVLGHKKILILANHGAVTTGVTVAEAYHRLYFLERAAMTQMIAMAAGKLRMIDGAVQKRVGETLSSLGPEYYAEIQMYFDAMKRVLLAEGSNFES